MTTTHITTIDVPADAAVDDRTLEILERRRSFSDHRRGWLVRRMLLVADITGLVAAFAVAASLHHPRVGVGPEGRLSLIAFVLALPLWVVAAKLYGLYDQ